MIKTILRSLIPHSDPRVYLLRVGVDFVERVPIIAWDVHLLSILPKGSAYPHDAPEAAPISIEECSSNMIECVVFADGRVCQPEVQSWDDDETAIADLQTKLRNDAARK